MINFENTSDTGLLQALYQKSDQSQANRSEFVKSLDVFDYGNAMRNMGQIPRDRPICLREYPSKAILASHLDAGELANSSLSEMPIVLLQGKKKDGSSRRGEIHQIKDFLSISDGTAYFGVMFDPDRSRRFMDRLSPAGVEPWHNLLQDAMPSWPLDLIKEELTGNDSAPHYNNSLVLSKGEGLGAPFHLHAPNLYLQVQGKKLWRFFAPGAFDPYINKGEPKFTGQLAVIDNNYAELCASKQFTAPLGMPSPVEFITHPNDMLSIPRDWMHSTWSLTSYTAALTLHADNDSSEQQINIDRK